MLFLLLLAACRNPTPKDVDPGHDLDTADTASDSVPCTALTWYADVDGDGYGDAASRQDACEAASGWVANATDCDDTLASVYPAAPEYCNGLDDDCDGSTDEEALDASTWYPDADADGFGDGAAPVVACEAGPAEIADATDCDDTDADVYPGGTEIEGTGADEDCDGRVDEIRVCADASGDFDSIQAAIDSAPVDGAVVEVCPGTYYEALEIASRVLELDGETGVPEDVVIDGSGIGEALHIEDGWDAAANFLLTGLTFIGDTSGAIAYRGSGSLAIRHFVIRDTSVGEGAMLAYFMAGQSTISDCAIYDNESEGSSYSPLVAFSGAAPAYSSSLRRCYLHDNGMESAGFYRGIYAAGATVSNNIVARNSFRASAIEGVPSSLDGSSGFYNNTLVGNSVSEGPVLLLGILDLGSDLGVGYLVGNVFCGNDTQNILDYGAAYASGCADCDSNHDGECSEPEAIVSCTFPQLNYNWICEAEADACHDVWCLAALPSNSRLGTDLGLSADTDPPYSLPLGSPAVDRGDPDAEYVDEDGSRNDPGRYGGPNAYE